MSEYQYYEFRAIDRLLGEKEQRSLRALSTRARITSSSFINTYEWGDFKGDPGDLMEKCFDAFLYLANWGTRELMLRVPRRLLGSETASLYSAGDHASGKVRGEHVIWSYLSDDESGEDYWLEADGWLSSLIPLRADMIRGDLRALYLGWLVGVQAGDCEDNAVEPPVPPGLGQSSAALKSFAQFLRVDENFVEAAAQRSPRLESRARGADLKAWIGALPQAEKDSLLLRLADYEDGDVAAELLRRFEQTRAASIPTSIPKRRSVAELRAVAEGLADEKRREAEEQRALEQARREREQAEARTKYLDHLAKREPAVWREVDALVGTLRPKDYDLAVKLLVDLRDLGAKQGRATEFQRRLENVRSASIKRPSLLRRMEKAGLQ